jgi:hypothetical protein
VGGVTLAGQELREVHVDLAHVPPRARGAVVAGNRHAVAALVERRTAVEMVALVDGDEEDRVALRDPVTLQAMEERRERGVVFAQLRLVAGLAGSEGIAVVDAEVLGVVDVGQICVRDGNAGLLRGGRVPERVVRLHPVEAGEAGIVGPIEDLGGRRDAREVPLRRRRVGGSDIARVWRRVGPRVVRVGSEHVVDRWCLPVTGRRRRVA